MKKTTTALTNGALQAGLEAMIRAYLCIKNSQHPDCVRARTLLFREIGPIGLQINNIYKLAVYIAPSTEDDVVPCFRATLKRLSGWRA